MEPIIIVYTKEEAKRPYDRFDSFIVAAFFIGTEYGEPEGSGNVESVRIEMYSADDPEGLDDLKTFVNLLLDRGINHETKFLAEPSPSDASAPSDEASPPPPSALPTDESQPPEIQEARISEYETRMRELRDKRQKGTLSEKQYEAQRQALLKKWRKEVDEGLSK